MTHPEAVAITPSRRTIVVIDEKGHTVIDMASITEFVLARPGTKKGAR